MYCYNNVPALSSLYDDADRTLAGLFSDYFVQYIKTGDPNGAGLPLWIASQNASEVMELGNRQGMTEDPFLPLYDVMDRMTGWTS